MERTTKLKVSGMKCGGCASKAREAVIKLPGVQEARFDHQAGTGEVTGPADPQKIIAALAGVGYRATVAD